MSMFFNPLSHAFGLDLGDRSFKLIQITRRRRPNQSPYFLTAWGSIDVPDEIMANGEILQLDEAIVLLKRLLKESHGHISGKTVVASLPEAKTFMKVIHVKVDADDEALKKEVVGEVQQNIPLPLEEIYFDWQRIPAPVLPIEPEMPFGDDDDQADDGHTPKIAAQAPEYGDDVMDPASAVPTASEPRQAVLIAAAPRDLVDKYTALIEGAGLIPAALEIEGMAVTRAIVPDEKMERVRLAMLDIGATRSSLIVYDENTVQISIGIPISGNQITQVVAEKLAMDLGEAERTKIECGLDVQLCEDRMWNILLPFIDEMSDRIRNALRFYRIGFESGKRIDRVYLCGGGAYFKEIDSVLSRKLGVKVRRGNALVNVNQKLPRAFSAATALSYTTAIGLALRAIAETVKKADVS